MTFDIAQVPYTPWVKEAQSWFENLGPRKEYTKPYFDEYMALVTEYQEIQKIKVVPSHLIQLLDVRLEPLTKILRAVTAGYEPCTPPKDWYCGIILPPNAKVPSLPSIEWFPRRDDPGTHQKDLLYFKGMMPAKVVQKWNDAIEVFSLRHIRIYSPDREDFTKPEIKFRDPIMIGQVYTQEEQWYFRIAQWDLAKDLAFMPKTST